MRRFNSYLRVLLSLTVVGMLATACDDNDEIAVDPNADFDVVLNVPAETNQDVEVTKDKGTILAKVHFVSTDDKMRRLYITRNVGGAGDEKFIPLEEVDDKPDGSIDVESKAGKEFDYQFKLPVPDNISAGTVVYKFWTTTGVGDFRDDEKRRAFGPATITLKYGGNNQAAAVKSYTGLKLDAPLENGLSNTFVSLLDGKVYQINEADYVAYWDFGYIYRTNEKATLYSTSTYLPIAVDIPDLTGVAQTELNKTYFVSTAMTVAEFDAVKVESDLDKIEVSEASQNIFNLVKDSIVAFKTQYGQKGLIRVTELKEGNGTDGYITISIKVQQ
jgi:hypothetical protein